MQTRPILNGLSVTVQTPRRFTNPDLEKQLRNASSLACSLCCFFHVIAGNPSASECVFNFAVSQWRRLVLDKQHQPATRTRRGKSLLKIDSRWFMKPCLPKSTLSYNRYRSTWAVKLKSSKKKFHHEPGGSTGIEFSCMAKSCVFFSISSSLLDLPPFHVIVLL